MLLKCLGLMTLVVLLLVAAIPPYRATVPAAIEAGLGIMGRWFDSLTKDPCSMIRATCRRDDILETAADTRMLPRSAPDRDAVLDPERFATWNKSRHPLPTGSSIDSGPAPGPAVSSSSARSADPFEGALERLDDARRLLTGPDNDSR